MLLAKRSVRLKGRKKRAIRTVTIGLAKFTIGAGTSAAVKVHLNAVGRGLLSSAHGSLTIRLNITEVPPESESTLAKIDSVHLVAQQQRRSHKRNR